MGLYEDLFDFNGNGKVDFDDDFMLMQMTKQSRKGGSGGGSSGGGCYIATCVYGSYDCPQVWTLRRFRDDQLARSLFGQLFIRAYYAVSPTAVRLFGRTAWFRRFWRGRLDRMVARLQAAGVSDRPYQDKRW